jgi:alpha-mannosidase
MREDLFSELKQSLEQAKEIEKSLKLKNTLEENIKRVEEYISNTHDKSVINSEDYLEKLLTELTEAYKMCVDNEVTYSTKEI